jgi:hypothetical protein
LEALGSDTVIVMEGCDSGAYNLSSEWGGPRSGFNSVKLQKGVWWQDVFDGGEITLTGVKNLTIRSENREEIVVDPRYAFVLNFIDCSNIRIENIRAGHSESGSCEGGVFGFKNSSNITIEDTAMYGCGTEGLRLADVSDMKVTNSSVYECTYHIMTIERGKNIIFENCIFTDNMEYELINISDSSGVTFSECLFTGNQGPRMFNVSGSENISVKKSEFRNNQLGEAEENSRGVSFENCKFEVANKTGEAKKIETIKVSNTREFLEALGSDRVIELVSYKYVLSEWDPHLAQGKGTPPTLPKGVSWRKHEYAGGSEFYIEGINNLTIKGVHSGAKANIIVTPRDVEVMNFVNCSDIVIEGLVAGHSEETDVCDGGVFSFTDSSRITIIDTDMFGCGTKGLNVENISELKVVNSSIYDCTDGIMNVSNSKNIAFENCVFRDNQGFTMILAVDTENMSFENCEFSDNRGSESYGIRKFNKLFYVTDGTVTVSNSTFSGNEAEESIQGSGNVKFINCVFEAPRTEKADKTRVSPVSNGQIPAPGDIPMDFGFADLRGRHLLVQRDKDKFDPALYTLAVGESGEVVRIVYAGWQGGTDMNNGRDMAYNFENIAGHVYVAEGGKFQPDGTYCITDNGFAGNLIKFFSYSGELVGKPAMEGETVKRVEELKGRKAKSAEKLAATDGGAEIGLVLFERQGDDMLFSIVYTDGAKTLSWDCPAEYDEISTWRADGGDEPGRFEFLFLVRFGDSLALMLEWGAPEGGSVVFLYEDDGKFIAKDDYSYHRYWAPD